MEFSPHPSSFNTQSLGWIVFLLSPPLVIHGLLALTSHCSSVWHAMLPGIQFIWATSNHKPYPLQPGRLTQRGPGEREKEADWGLALRGGGQESQSKTCLLSKNPPLYFLWNVRGDGILYLLVCLQIANAVFWPLSRASWKECHKADRAA